MSALHGVKPKRRGRDIHEPHRVSTPLELLFDLTFVVAISLSASQFHHDLSSHHTLSGVLHFAVSFFGIWWAWVNYSWFASAYDNDDVWFRLLTMVQMFGVLVFAVGIPGLFHDQWGAVIVGFVLMRGALAVQWLRAAAGDPERAPACRRYAVGILVAQAGWVLRLWLPQPWNFIAIPLLMALELDVPAWAERGCKDGTPWHAHHIAERYGLMTIIVLGECVLGTANDVASVYQAIGWSWQLGLVGLGGLGLVLCLWWIYFLLPSGEALHNHRERAWGWGYAHFFLFGSIAAMGSGLQVVADVLKHAHPDLTGVHAVTPLYAILSVALPQLVFMAVVWFLWTYASQAKAARRYHLAPLVLACLAAVVLGVSQGLALAWALPLLCLAPILTITYHSCGQQHRGGDYQVQ